MTKDDYPSSLAASLAQLQTRLPRIAKTETADTGKYKYAYAGLADISAQVLPLLGDVGLSFTAKPTHDENGRYVLLCKLLHVSGEHETGTYLLPTGGTPQALGSAITYGRRYLLCAMVGIAPDEDDDGAAAEAAAQQQGPRTAQRANKPAAENKPAARSTTTRQRRPAPAEPPLPSDEPPADEQAPPAAEDNQANRAQQNKLHAQLGELGLDDRSSKLTTVGLLVGRTIESSSDLTKAEASTVIDTFDRVLADDDPGKALDAVLAAAEQNDPAGGESS